MAKMGLRLAQLAGGAGRGYADMSAQLAKQEHVKELEERRIQAQKEIEKARTKAQKELQKDNQEFAKAQKEVEHTFQAAESDKTIKARKDLEGAKLRVQKIRDKMNADMTRYESDIRLVLGQAGIDVQLQDAWLRTEQLKFHRWATSENIDIDWAKIGSMGAGKYPMSKLEEDIWSKMWEDTLAAASPMAHAKATWPGIYAMAQNSGHYGIAAMMRDAWTAYSDEPIETVVEKTKMALRSKEKQDELLGIGGRPVPGFTNPVSYLLHGMAVGGERKKKRSEKIEQYYEETPRDSIPRPSPGAPRGSQRGAMPEQGEYPGNFLNIGVPEDMRKAALLRIMSEDSSDIYERYAPEYEEALRILLEGE